MGRFFFSFVECFYEDAYSSRRFFQLLFPFLQIWEMVLQEWETRVGEKLYLCKQKNCEHETTDVFAPPDGVCPGAVPCSLHGR